MTSETFEQIEYILCKEQMLQILSTILSELKEREKKHTQLYLRWLLL